MELNITGLSLELKIISTENLEPKRGAPGKKKFFSTQFKFVAHSAQSQAKLNPLVFRFHNLELKTETHMSHYNDGDDVLFNICCVGREGK